MIESTSEGNTYSEVSSSLQHSESSESSTDLETSSSNLQHSESSESSTDLETSSSNLQHSESSESSTDLETSSLSLSNLHDSDFSSRHIGPLKPCLATSNTEDDLRKSVIGLLKRRKLWSYAKLYSYASIRELKFEKERIPILFKVLEKMIFEGVKSRVSTTRRESEEERTTRELLEEYDGFVSKTEKDCLDRTDFWSKRKEIYRCLNNFMEDEKLVKCSRKSVGEATKILKKKFKNGKIYYRLDPGLLMCILNDLLMKIFEDAPFPHLFRETRTIMSLLANFTYAYEDSYPENLRFLDTCWRFCQHIAIKVDSRRVYFWQTFFNHYQDRFEHDLRFKGILQKVWQRISSLYEDIATQLQSDTSWKKHISCILKSNGKVPATDFKFKPKLIGMSPVTEIEYESELTGMPQDIEYQEYLETIILHKFYYNGESPIACCSTYIVGTFFEIILCHNKVSLEFSDCNGNFASIVGTYVNMASDIHSSYPCNDKKKKDYDIVTKITCTLKLD